MNYVEYGSEQNDTMIFLHGGGLAPWNYFEEIRQLQEEYHIVIPVLDGHNGSDRDFTSIESNADEIIDFIDHKFSGQVLLIGGLSLGGQILIEILSKRKDICKYAIIESALVLPMKITYALIKPTFSLCYPLVKKHWFAQVQFNALHIRKELFENYYRDSAAITKANMIAFLKANSDYKLKREIEECKSKVLVLVGSRESKIMKISARILQERIQNATLAYLPGYYHGDLSINHSDIYIRKIKQLIREDDGPTSVSVHKKLLNYKEQAGMKKKSFELNYNGGTIWCEHLDSMGNMEAEVIKKFEEDYQTFSLPSVSSYMIINLDETNITEQIVACILNGIIKCKKKFMKIAFVGVGGKEQKQFQKIMKESGVIVSFSKITRKQRSGF